MNRKWRFNNGLIAQEVEDVIPEVVEVGKLGMEGLDDLKSVKYDRLVPLLIEAVKELSAKVEAQQTEIEELKN